MHQKEAPITRSFLYTAGIAGFGVGRKLVRSEGGRRRRRRGASRPRGGGSRYPHTPPANSMADRDESGIMNDERFKWLKQRAVQSLRVKDDKWNRLMDDDDVTTTAITFFENEMIQTIFIYQNELDELVMSEHPPARIADKKKAVYFTKTAAFQKIEKNKTPAEIMYGDISDNVLLTLQAEMDGVFIPLLKQATTGWPELLQKDI